MIIHHEIEKGKSGGILERPSGQQPRKDLYVVLFFSPLFCSCSAKTFISNVKCSFDKKKVCVQQMTIHRI